MRKIAKSIVFWALGGTSIGLFFGVLFIFSYLPIFRWYNALDWIETPCTVLESKIGLTYDKHPDPSYGKKDKVTLQILYQYEVDGRIYLGKRLDFISPVYWQRKPDKILSGGNELYPSGLAGVCFVNPDDHAESVFRNQFPFGVLVPVIALTTLLISGISLAIREIRRKKSNISKHWQEATTIT